MFVGVQRTMVLEMPEARTQFLDHATPSDIDPKLIAARILFIDAQISWGREDSVATSCGTWNRVNPFGGLVTANRTLYRYPCLLSSGPLAGTSTITPCEIYACLGSSMLSCGCQVRDRESRLNVFSTKIWLLTSFATNYIQSNATSPT